MELVYICPRCEVVHDAPAPDVCEYCKLSIKDEEAIVTNKIPEEFFTNQVQMSAPLWVKAE